MKANIEKLYKLFLNLQIQQSLPNYEVNISYKSQLYIDTAKSVIEFSYIKPQSVLKYLGINYNRQQL